MRDLGEDAEIGVVVHIDRQAEPAGEAAGDVGADPTGEDRAGVQHAGVGVDRAGNADCHRLDLVSADAGAGEHLLDPSRCGGDCLVGGNVDRERLLGDVHQSETRVEQPDLQAEAAEVDADDVQAGAAERDQRPRTPDATRRREYAPVGARDDALVQELGDRERRGRARDAELARQRGARHRPARIERGDDFGANAPGCGLLLQPRSSRNKSGVVLSVLSILIKRWELFR